MVGGGHGDLGGGEDLVLMGVEEDVLVSGRGAEFAVPVGLDVFEGVVDGGAEVGRGGLDGFVAGLVVAEDFVEVEIGAEGLVEEFDHGDDVGVGGVALGEVFDGGDGLGDGGALLPVDGAVATAVVEAVLRARCAVEIEHDLETCASGPADGLIEDFQLTLDVGVTLQWCDSPISDGDANMVQTNLSNLVEVVLGNPRVPMITQTGVGLGRT